MDDLPAASRRVVEAAHTLGLTITVVEMAETTRTAEDAARACGCAVAQIVKSLMFRGKTSGRPYLLLVSGANRVKESVAAKTIGERIVRPDAGYVRDVTGFAIGGVPPMGHAQPLVPYLDSDLLRYDTVWAAAGTPNTVFEVAPGDLSRALGAIVMPIS